MPSFMQPLADFLFGLDPIDDQQRAAQQAYLDKLAHDYQAREQADYVHQSNYGRMLLDQANGVGAPSVADRQLTAGLDAINRNAQSTVAGASGNNASLMSYGALLNAGNLESQFNQQKAIQAAQERQSAQQQYGQLLSNMGGRSAGLFDTASNQGLGYTKLGLDVQGSNQKAQAASLGTLMSTLGTIGGAFAGGAPGAAAGSKAGAPLTDAVGTPNPYSQAQPGYEASHINYGAALTAADQPTDPYQSSYQDGLYRGPSTDRGMR